MKPRERKVLVTGGAGFIGSKLIEKSLKLGCEVRAIDNLSAGSMKNIEYLLKEKRFEFIKGDLLEEKAVKEALDGCELVFHLAANPEVQVGTASPWTHLEQNVIVTYRLLEGMRESAHAKTIAFTSSSTVYGEATELPTREDYGPLLPISIYGASKLACEALITAYFHTFKINCTIYRLANVVGPQATHGVVIDFFHKLKKNPSKLEILGDGTQKKSYIYIDDCVDGMIYALEHAKEPVEIFNIGSVDCLDVKTVANLVSEQMKLSPEYIFKWEEEGRGWKGDVRQSWLAIEKLKKIGWKPRYNSEQAIRLTLNFLLKSLSNKIDF
jgi:UDP-glucose 4-epimerase